MGDGSPMGIYHVDGTVKLEISMVDDLSSARAIRENTCKNVDLKGSPAGPYLRNWRCV